MSPPTSTMTPAKDDGSSTEDDPAWTNPLGSEAVAVALILAASLFTFLLAKGL